MRRNKTAFAGFLGAVSLCVGQVLLYFPALPERMASHFGPGGAPDGWMRRNLFIELNLGVVGLLTCVFLAISHICGSRDEASIKLPSKEYWMAPERRQETVDFLSGYLLWFGTATLLLMFDVFRQAFRFNLSPLKALDHPVASVAAYLSFVIAWTIGFRLRFPKK